MSFVLSYTLPPVPPAAFGHAEILASVTSIPDAGALAFKVLIGEGRQFLTWGDADRYRNALIEATIRETGSAVATHTGWSFRIDTADQAPHPCPCCGRLVLPEDHAYARDEDAYCLGCFTWQPGTPACLPANSAHTEEP